jgi:hypothetical protein
MSTCVKPGIGFWLVFLIASLAAPGCLVAPIGNYHTPESLGEGEMRQGVAVAAAPEIDTDFDFFYILGEADYWIDFGLMEQLDLRARAFLVKGFPAEYYANFWIPGLSLEAKLSNRAGTAALIAGVSPQLIVDIRHDDQNFLIASWLGGVFGIGRPGNVRLLLSPRLAAGLSSVGAPEGAAASLSVGLDLPITKRVAIRPEVTMNCAIIIRNEETCGWDMSCTIIKEGSSACWAGLGAAVVF